MLGFAIFVAVLVILGCGATWLLCGRLDQVTAFLVRLRPRGRRGGDP